MNITHASIATCCFVAATVFAGAAAAAPDAARAQYDAERARCMSGTTGQDQASCLKSAGAAYDEARNGRLANPNSDYRANAMSRCAALTGGDRTDCEARVDVGTPGAAVRSGGDVKETITVSPAGSTPK